MSQDCSSRMLQTKQLEAEMRALETLKLEVHRGSCAWGLAASETWGEIPSPSPSFWWDRAPWLAWLAVVTSWAMPPLSHRILPPPAPVSRLCSVSLLFPQGHLSPWIEDPTLLQCDLILNNLNSSILSAVLSHEGLC